MRSLMRWIIGTVVAGGAALTLCAGLIVADGLTDEVRPSDVAVVLG